MDFTNKNAIVTGGANGIGRCIVEYFVRAGVNKVLAIDIDENITIDGGMSKLMVYHNDKGWSYKGS